MPKLPKCLFVALLLLSAAAPASALPGQSLDELRQWTRSHSFLSPDLIGPLPTLNADYAIVYKQLDEQLFLDLRYYFNGMTDPEQDTANYVELELARRDYQPPAEPDPVSDPRPWVSTALEPIWSRGSERALDLLKQVYGPELAEDFRSSRLIYQGPEFVAERPSCYFRERISDFKYRIYVWEPQVQLLLGQRYAYEISPKADGRGETLKIISRADGLDDAKILAHNRWVAKIALRR